MMLNPDLHNIAFLASPTEDAQNALRALTHRYGNVKPEDAEVVVALGGDGHALRAMHRMMNTGIPIYGMNRGSVGFLMNNFEEDNLVERILAAHQTVIHPLSMEAEDVNGLVHEALAINEVSLWRQTYQAAKLRIIVDGKTRMEELVCDGAMVATSAGSTAYNLSAHGPILPIDAPLLALTPISPFRPRRWRGALLSNRARVRFEVVEPHRRPVSVAADHVEYRFIRAVSIREDQEKSALMLFDADHGLEERILSEQFDMS